VHVISLFGMSIPKNQNLDLRETFSTETGIFLAIWNN